MKMFEIMRNILQMPESFLRQGECVASPILFIKLICGCLKDICIAILFK